MTVQPYLELWRLIPEQRVETTSGEVLFVRRGQQRLVLKVPSADEPAQAAVLEHYGGVAAVRVLARDGPVMLLERARPGRPLSALVYAGRDDEATEVLSETMRRLHRRPAAAGLATVEDWGRGFARVRRQALAVGADAAMIDRAAAIYDQLCRSQSARVLLHGDLHHDNVLEDQRRGWLAIDPKGVAGEPAFEAGAMLRNPGDDPGRYADAWIIRRRAALLGERLGLDLRRILSWCFAQAVLSALWAIEDGVDPARGWRVAEASQPLA